MYLKAKNLNANNLKCKELKRLKGLAEDLTFGSYKEATTQ